MTRLGWQRDRKKIFVTTSIQGIYTYISETNHASRVYVIQFPMLNVMYFYTTTFRSMCAVSNMAVFY